MNKFYFLLCSSVLLLIKPSALADDALQSGFQNPPLSARPQTWWHWMNGNITKVGIKDDLEAMKEIGLGGATIVNVDCGIPRGPVEFMSSEWREDFKYAVQAANRLGLKLCVENCAGWSSSGGPWNTPTNAMQRVTSCKLYVTGPTNFFSVLPQPSTKLNFYRDIAVLAWRALPTNATIANIKAKDGQSGRAVLSSNVGDSTNGAVQKNEIFDLTSKLSPDGRLNWNVPPGKWVVLRLGYTPTGVNNHPAAWGGLGLECDKMSKSALDEHWNGFMQKVLEDLGPLAGKALNCSLIDSYEVGGQNWTKNFRREFEKLRGYDPVKFLPTFTGQVVDNPEISERFLWDVRRTIADLYAENYYDHFAELCREHGLLSAVEPYTGPFESLQCGAPADVVMGEFWSGSHGHPSVKLAASIAHIYGKTIVGAESFTAAPDNGRWQNYPYKLKALGDLMYCQGLNRYIFHRYAMQPWTNRWPGMTMGQWGFHFERTETWWRQGKPWIDYISHCEFMLQQGRAVQDVAYFDGQSAPVEMRVGKPSTPVGYDYDAVNADVLRKATVKHGRLTLRSGANYAVLVLPPDDINMTPQMLECLRKLVRDGVTVVGPRPQHSPSLEDYPRCDKQVKQLAHELWGDCNGSNIQEHVYGKGRVVWGKPLAEIFAEQNLKPDFTFTNMDGKANLAYTHRIDGDTDIYFVSNQRRRFDSVECTFRVSGKSPELWHPDTGVIEPAPVWSEHDGRTTVPLKFDPAGSVFVVFRPAARHAEHLVSATGDFPPETNIVSKLEIQRAIYQAVDETNETDVTAKLSALAQDGQLIARADNNTLGGDPALQHRKQLRVDYTLNGQPGHITVAENQTLTVPANASTGSAPRWKINIGKNGSPVVTAWADGRVKMQTANGKILQAIAVNVPPPTTIKGQWKLNFPPHWGAPPSVTLNKLISWTDDTNSGVRYFSGTATYEKDIEIPADRLTDGHELWLDLGVVKDFAEVSLNGHDFGVLWKPPFRVNITSVAKPGKNKLEVKVTNLWPNRLIGDEQLPPDVEWGGKQLKAWPQWLLDGKPSPTGRLTFTTWHHWTKTDALLESGLLGPVTLCPAEIVPAQ